MCLAVLIRLFLKEQADLGLHYIIRLIFLNIKGKYGSQNKRTLYHVYPKSQLVRCSGTSSFGTDLGPNCLQRLSADDKSPR